MSVTNQVLDVLKKSGKYLKSGEIAEISGLDKKEVDSAIKTLKKEEKIYSPKRCYYAPK